MDVFIIIMVLILLSVGMMFSDYRARKSNQEWCHLKALTLKRLKQYEGENREFVEEQATRFCCICDIISQSGILASKRNQILAVESTLILQSLKPLGFFEGKIETGKEQE